MVWAAANPYFCISGEDECPFFFSKYIDFDSVDGSNEALDYTGWRKSRDTQQNLLNFSTVTPIPKHFIHKIREI
jgi:hypothetical protein